MPKSPLRMFKSVREFVPIQDLKTIKRGIRGVYVLFDKVGANKFKVVYVGKSEKSVKGRMVDHARSKRKMGKWDHFSIFKVHDNISDEEIRELENFILFIFRKDPRTIGLNTQKSAKAFRLIRKVPLSD